MNVINVYVFECYFIFSKSVFCGLYLPGRPGRWSECFRLSPLRCPAPLVSRIFHTAILGHRISYYLQGYIGFGGSLDPEHVSREEGRKVPHIRKNMLEMLEM
jgi:hypothetical protein